MCQNFSFAQTLGGHPVSFTSASKMQNDIQAYGNPPMYPAGVARAEAVAAAETHAAEMSQFPTLDMAFDMAERRGVALRELEAIDQALASGSLSIEEAIETLEAMQGDPHEGAFGEDQHEPTTEQQGSSDLFSGP